MNIAFACPQCDRTTQAERQAGDESSLACRHCGHTWPAAATVEASGHMTGCLACGGGELFVRKDFSQRLGVTIIAAGFIASSIAWAYYLPYWSYGILFASALIDVAIYFIVGNVLECYRCHAQYRDLPGLNDYEPFKLEVHEKYRQQAIRLKEAQSVPRSAHR